MKRWAIARMREYEEGSIDSAFSQYAGVNFRQWTKPGFNWCFAHIATNNLTQFDADPDIYVLPDGAMDMSVGSIPAGVRNTLKTKAEAAGLIFTDVKLTWTVRQMLTYLSQQIQPDINIEAGDVRDVE